ncbi:MAG: hypothetical protein WC373_02970 [Smithella sp.]|jgi:hypothetical protein
MNFLKKIFSGTVRQKTATRDWPGKTPAAKQIILTNYFTGKKNPQKRGNQFEPDQFENMKRWYESLMAHQLHGLVFHDQLSRDFVDKYSNDVISFEKYDLKKKYSLNDDRFFCWYEWLLKHEEVECLFCTDLFDVDFFGNPFHLMDHARYDLYCGDDNGTEMSEWVNDRMKWAYGRTFHAGKIKFVAGVVGGTRENMLHLLQAMTLDFEKAKRAARKGKNMNMGVFNKCVHDLFDQSRILFGPPLNSRFRKYETAGNFSIRHK